MGSDKGRFVPDEPALDAAGVGHALTQIGRLGEGIKAQFDLIGVRMTWLVLSESFSFSAFTLTVANYDPAHRLAEVQLYLIWALPIVGMGLAVFVFVGIRAAHHATLRLKRQREVMMARVPDPLRVDLISSFSPEHWWGEVPQHAIPPIFFTVWLGVFAWLVALSPQGRMG